MTNPDDILRRAPIRPDLDRKPPPGAMLTVYTLICAAVAVGVVIGLAIAFAAHGAILGAVEAQVWGRG